MESHFVFDASCGASNYPQIVLTVYWLNMIYHVTSITQITSPSTLKSGSKNRQMHLPTKLKVSAPFRTPLRLFLLKGWQFFNIR